MTQNKENKYKNCPSPENPCMCDCHIPIDGEFLGECLDCRCGRHKTMNKENKDLGTKMFEDMGIEIIDATPKDIKCDKYEECDEELEHYKKYLIKEVNGIEIENIYPFIKSLLHTQIDLAEERVIEKIKKSLPELFLEVGFSPRDVALKHSRNKVITDLQDLLTSLSKENNLLK